MTLSLSLLGSPVITIDGTPLDVDTRKAVALLAYLVLEPGPHPRDRLVDLLWPDSDVERARSSLRRTLSALRSGLDGRWVTADRNVVTVLHDDLEVDVVSMRDLATPHLTHVGDGPCSRCVAALTSAVDLARGDFLDGFYLRDSAPFESWMITQAEESRRLLGEALRALAALHASDGAYPEAIEAARRRIDVDPLHEEAHRDLMLYLAWSGDRSGAIDAYRRLVSILDVELGVPPLDDTTALYEQVLEDTVAPAPAPARPSVVAATRTPPTDVPFVGREAELTRAIGALAEPGGVVVVTGPMGSGITRFLDEVSSRLRRDGATVLRATATASAITVPYGVIHEALYDEINAPTSAERLAGLPAQVLIEASRLFPGLASETPPPAEASSRAGFFDALSRVLGALDRPVLVVDDAHLCDPASAEAIASLVGTARHSGLAVLLAAAADEVPSESGVQTVLHDMVRRGTTLTLPPLDAAAVGSLTSWFGVDLAPAVLIDRSGGLPLFAVEMLRAAAEGSDATVPDPVRRALTDRISGLGGAGHQVLDALAILDRGATPDLLAAVSGRSADEVDAALDDLVAAGMVREAADGTATITHAYLANVVLGSATVARRRMLNRRAALAAEQRAPAPGLASRIARHHALAGNDARAAEWFVVAGDEAAAVFAHREAIAAYEAAIAAGHPDRAGLHRAVAHSALLEGRYDQAIAGYEAALAAGDRDPAGAEHLLGEIHRRLRRWDIAIAHYDRAAAATDDPGLGAIIGADRAYVEHQRGDQDAASAWAERSLRLAEASGNRSALARAHNVAGLISTDPATRRDHLEQALDQATEPAERVAVLNNLAAASEPAAGVAFARSALEQADALGDRHVRAALFNTLADALHRAGDEEASQAALTEAVELFAEITADGDEGWVPEVWFLSEW